MWTEFLLASSAIGFLLSMAAAFVSARTVVRVQALQDELVSWSKSSPASLISRVDSIDTKVEELGLTLSTLAQKYKMQKVRNAANHVAETGDAGAMPDPYRDADGWRKAMNAKIARAKVGL